MFRKHCGMTLLILFLSVLCAACFVSCNTTDGETGTTPSTDVETNQETSTKPPFTGFREEDGVLRYYIDGTPQSGWIEVDGKKYYAASEDARILTEDQAIDGKQYVWTEDAGLILCNGFLTTTDGTACYLDGIQVTGWRHKDGSSVTVNDGISEEFATQINGLYYFAEDSGYMVTDPTYTVDGYVREFNDDHSVKPLNGLQQIAGRLYLYESGVMKTGWYTDSETDRTYYFLDNEAEYGQAASRWRYIDDKIFYFNTPDVTSAYALKTSGPIGGIEYSYDPDSGCILYNGFINCDFANSANDDTADSIRYMDSTTKYYINGEMQTGWKAVNGNTYYFELPGSANGAGYMCCESRMIDGVLYEFTANGEFVLSDNLILVTDQRNGHEGIAVIDLSKIDLSDYDPDLDYAFIPEEAEVFRYSGRIYDAAGIKIRKSDALGGYVILVAYGANYASVISYPGGELLFQTGQTGRGPHSVELLPEGWLVVAAPGNSSSSYSDGSLTFFNANPDTGSDLCRLTINLPNAHGVLYDPEGNCIWAVGNDLLKKYTYTIEDGQICVEEVLSETIPKSGAHDLSAFYGDTDKLLITTSSYVYVYTKSSGTFKKASSSQSLVTASKIKGYGLLQDGSVVFAKPGAVYADGMSETWLTDCIYYYKKTEDGLTCYRLVTDFSEYYKIRVMRAEYQ